jgi:hypothetical protein
MDHTQARTLLAAERARLQWLLQAETGQPQAAEEGDDAVGLVSAGHPFELMAPAGAGLPPHQVARLIRAAAQVGARD